jgi:catechol 2,3-dioxygenase-like lactoylglutathione lyase family enzyme
MTFALGAGAYLHHLHLTSPDPSRLAAFYGDVMDMAVARTADGALLCRGAGRRLLITDGPPRQLAHAAFACNDEGTLAAIGERAARGRPGPTAADNALLRDALAVVDPDGNRMLFGLAAGDTPDGEPRLKGPLQHLTLATSDVDAIERFYAGTLGFAVSDRVRRDTGEVTTSFMRSNHEHHTLACFLAARAGIDHHAYETGDWVGIRDWADRFAARGLPLMWGPGRHGPGNNLFIFIEDPDGNWIEISAELETVRDRPTKDWPHAERTLNLWGRAIMRS